MSEIRISELFDKLRPYIRDLISVTSGLDGPFAPAPHDIGGAHHSGSLTDAQGPQFLLSNGGRQITGNQGVADGITIDGVDLSVFKSAYDVHAGAAAVTAHGSVGAHNHQSTGAGGQIDHGLGLSGLADDDHTQYLNTTRHDTTTRHGSSVVDHGSIGGLADDDHSQYLNTTRHDTTTRHGSSVVDHGSIGGLGDDDHAQYLLANGSRAVAGNLTPDTTDTRDLGSSTKFWRQGWISELQAVLFAQNSVSLLGGWLIVSKDEGALPGDITAGATQINFGKAMTVGDFVLFRTGGQVEYMSVGSLVSGTTYNVTRNLDGSGANAWTGGTPFCVLGQTGNGRIELNAYDTPRISIIKQGAAYNTQTEAARIGDLNGSYGITSELYGIGIGDYAGGNYLRHDPTNGFVVKSGSGKINIDSNGIAMVGSTSQSYSLERKIKWTEDGAPSNELAYIGAAKVTAGTVTLPAFNASYATWEYGVGIKGAGANVNTHLVLSTAVNSTSFGSSIELDAGDGTNSSNLAVHAIGIMLSNLSYKESLDATSGWAKFRFACTRTSNTQFTISGDYTSVFEVGVKVRITDTTTKYFYVVSASYAGGTTTVNITGGSDYSLAASPTAVWFSRGSRPEGFPEWFAYTPSLTASPTNPTLGSGSIASGVFWISGRKLTAKVFVNYGSGMNPGSGSYLISLPVAGINQWNYVIIGLVHLYDNSVTTRYEGTAFLNGSDVNNAIFGFHGGNIVTNSAPFTWAANDTIQAILEYRI